MDVTDREERERELAAINERLDVALEFADAGVYEWYVGEERVYWHESTSRLFGLDPETTVRPPQAFLDQVHPDDVAAVDAAVREAVESGGQLAVEYRTNDPGTKPRWMLAEGEVIEDDGEPTRLVGTVRDVTERKEREEALAEREQRLSAVIESSPDPIAMQDTDGEYRVVNEAMAEVTGCSRAELQGATPAAVFDDETAERVETHRREVLETERARVVEEHLPADGPSRTIQLTVAPHYGPDGSVRGTVALARDITELERQREELETLTDIQALVHESISALTAATTREEIKATVCERLTESAFYEAATIGSRDPSSRRIEPDYATDRAADYLADVTVTTGPDPTGLGPGGTAYRTGEVQVVQDVAADPAFEPWADAAVEHGFGAVVVVPLTQGATTHGILAVYSGQTDAFSEREVTAFEVLGEAVGFALSAAQHRRMLESDRVLELEYEVESQAAPFVRATAEHDCRFVIESAAHAGDGTVVNYLTVEGVAEATGADVAREHDNLVSIRPLDRADGPDFELTWRDSVFQYLAEAGARGTRGVVEDGVGRMHVEAPGDVDVRQVTDAMRERFDDVRLAAKRERDRADTPWWPPHADVSTRLTDRQRSILQAAYYSGYYEWPRDTDAETLAETLDIATTTLLQHLRKGHDRVLEAMFES